MSMLFEEERKLGFDFELCKRNQFLTEKGVVNPPKFLKTGTTITGLVFEGGIVLGADTRATEGPIVADKNCEKIHYIAPNIYCCGAGTAADTENTTALISSQLTLHRMATGKQSRVVTACTLLKRFLFQYQGHVSAALVLGGVDVTGPHLYTIHPHGSVDELPYVTMGSGSLAAMAVFEAGFRPGLSETEAKDLVHASICAGIFNDLGSGSNVDLCVIRTGGVVEYFRNYDRPNDVSVVRAKQYTYPRGTTPVLKTVVQDIRQLVDVEEGPAPMEI